MIWSKIVVSCDLILLLLLVHTSILMDQQKSLPYPSPLSLLGRLKCSFMCSDTMFLRTSHTHSQAAFLSFNRRSKTWHFWHSKKKKTKLLLQTIFQSDWTGWKIDSKCWVRKVLQDRVSVIVVLPKKMLLSFLCVRFLTNYEVRERKQHIEMTT